MTNNSRDTTTGARFEESVHIDGKGINLTKYNLYNFLESQGINWQQTLSKKLLPDEAYFNPETGHFDVYEKKFQETNGSADEKPQTCAFKIKKYREIGALFGATNVTYTYIFNDWWKKPEYKDTLDFINETDGCYYIFASELNNTKKEETVGFKFGGISK